MTASDNLRIAVIGAGPVGLALALLAAELLPEASITVFDARAADRDVSADPRTLALSLGSVHLLQRLKAWPGALAEPIDSVHVSQSVSAGQAGGDVTLTAADVGEPMLGAVLSYGALVAHLQSVWNARVHDAQAQATQPGHGPRLVNRFGAPVTGLREEGAGVLVRTRDDTPDGEARRFDLAVIAEGGVFAEQARKALRHDYRQAAWVGTVRVQGAPRGRAVERFTRHGPVALLPLPDAAAGVGAPPGARRAALVWCVPSDDDPLDGLDDAQRQALLNTMLPVGAGEVVGLGPLKRFALGLNAERTLVSGRQVRIGNAAQTLHPVAGQGLNLGLRDAFVLVQALQSAADVGAALRRVEWSRAPDRWSMIATTDFLARSFTWQWPGVAALRGLALSALQAVGPARRALARHMMFGRR